MTITVTRHDEITDRRKAWQFTIGEDFRLHFGAFRIFQGDGAAAIAQWRAHDLTNSNNLERPEPVTAEIVSEALEILRSKVTLAFDIAP